MCIDVRPYTDGDRQDIISLHRDIMDSTQTEKLFDWKYLQAPNTQNPRIAVAEENGEIIGFVGDFRVPLQIRKIPITARQPVDIMIEEDFRSARLFVDLVDELRSSFDDDSVVVEFGEPTLESRKIWKQFENWSFYNYNQRIRIQRPEALVSDSHGVSSLARRLVQLAGLPLRLSLRIQDQIAQLQEPTSIDVRDNSGYVGSVFGTPPTEKYPLCIRRDHEFWNWRASDPRRVIRTYWVGSKNSPDAAVLVGRNIIKNSCEIALQETSNDDNTIELLNIYNKIMRDYRDVATIKVPAKMMNEFSYKINMSHDQLISMISKTAIGGFLSDRYNMNFENFGSWILGWKWYDDVPEIDPIPISKWEFNNLLLD